MKIELTILSWRLNLLQSQLTFVVIVTSIESVVMVRQRKWFVFNDVADLNKNSSIFFSKALFILTFMILNNSSLLKNISNNFILGQSVLVQGWYCYTPCTYIKVYSDLTVYNRMKLQLQRKASLLRKVLFVTLDCMRHCGCITWYHRHATNWWIRRHEFR